MSKFIQIIDAVFLIIIVVLLAKGTHWLIGGAIASWPIQLQMALEFLLAFVVLIFILAAANDPKR